MVASGRGPGRLASPATGSVLACFAVVVVAAAIWLGALVPGGDLGQNILSFVVFIMLGAVGVVVARAQPRNPVGWLLILARQVARYRSASGEERAQLKWLLWGAIVFAISGTVITLSGALDPNPSVIVQVAVGVALVTLNAFPLSVGVAILKYRLYEIDRVISRTLAYVIVTGLLVGCYVGVVALGTDVLPFRGSVAVAASTLVVAALFNPLAAGCSTRWTAGSTGPGTTPR
jgi:hypothetical protein